jgi:uroporphyrinogen-III synthase
MSRLSGRVVATTRDGDPDDPLARALEAEGARVVAWPTIAFEPPSDPEAVAGALERLEAGGYDWVVFTSARAVDALGGAGAVPDSVRVAAVGEATARALTRAGRSVDVVGAGDASALVDAVAAEGSLAGARVLFPAASRAGEGLEEGLAGLGARVERVEAYRTVLVPPDRARVRTDLHAGVDVVTFASPSAVASLARALGDEWPSALDGIGVAAIGPSTRRAVADHGVRLERVEMPERPGVEGLVEACVACIERIEGNGS